MRFKCSNNTKFSFDEEIKVFLQLSKLARGLVTCFEVSTKLDVSQQVSGESKWNLNKSKDHFVLANFARCCKV